MRILLIGKRASITHWLERAAGGLASLGHTVRIGVWRDPRLHAAIDKALVSPRLGAPRGAGLARLAEKAELVLAIGGFSIPPAALQRLAAAPGRPPLAAWVGDGFGPEAAPLAALFDVVGYTDSGLLARHHELGFATPALFLPHAVDPAAALPPLPEPRQALSFVAVPTPRRRALLAGLSAPIALYGPGWSGLEAAGRRIEDRRLRPGEVVEVYRRSRAVLNIRNELNVLDGLNQRSFEPYLYGAAVLSDAQPDLSRCFEPGREVLVFRGVDELARLHARVLAKPAFIAAIAAAGARRVLAEHTYGHRLQTLAGALGERFGAAAASR